MSRGQEPRKHLRRRAFPQWLTAKAVNYCCKALHLRYLWGPGYASGTINDYLVSINLKTVNNNLVGSRDSVKIISKKV